MRITTILLLVGAAFTPALAQEKKVNPNTKTPQIKDAIKVISVTGSAQKLVAVKKKKDSWTAVKVNDVLGELTIIRTALRTKVVVEFPDKSLLTIKSATKIGIGEYLQKGSAVKARLGLKYGAIRLKVEKGTGKTDYQLATPVATLSVRGSECDVAVGGDSGLKFSVKDGKWAKGSPNPRTYSPGENGDGKGNPSVIIWMIQRQIMIMEWLGLSPKEQMLNFLMLGGGRNFLGLPGGFDSLGFRYFLRRVLCSGGYHNGYDGD